MPALMKTNEKYSSPMSRNFKDVFMMGGGGGRGTNLPPSIQTYVNFRNFADLNLRSLNNSNNNNNNFYYAFVDVPG